MWYFNNFIMDFIDGSGLEEKQAINLIQKVVKTAYEKTYGSSDNCIVDVSESNSKITVYEEKNVVEGVYLERKEIELQDARKIDSNLNIGDKIKVPFDLRLLSRNSIMHAPLILYEESNNINKDTIIEEIKQRIASSGGNDPTRFVPGQTQGIWRPYIEEYKPCHGEPLTKTEEYLEDFYNSGYMDYGPNPFPFNNSGTEDDYGDESWA